MPKKGNLIAYGRSIKDLRFKVIAHGHGIKQSD